MLGRPSRPNRGCARQANRLLTATVCGRTTTNVYDGDGKRTSQTVGINPTTTYAYDVAGGLPVVLTDGSRTYVNGLELAYTVDGTGSLQMYYADGLGSVRAITDSGGNVVQTLQTDAFGVPISSRGSVSQPFGFTGQQLDANGLVYLRARFYDPVSGRFMSRDPFAGAQISPLSLHRYIYVENSPLRAGDPSGMAPGVECVCGQVGTIASGGGSKVKDDGSSQHLACQTPNGQNSQENMNFACTRPQVLAEVPVQIQTSQGIFTGTGVVAMSPMAPGSGSRGNGTMGFRSGGVIRPYVTNSKLINIVNDHYKGLGKPNQIGTGSTADAIRYEKATGNTVRGTFHSLKGQQYVNGLNNWLTDNPSASAGDRLAAQTLKADPQAALSGK